SVRVLVHHQDNAGNRSSNERNYFKDTVLPEVTITNPENSSIVNSQNFNNLNFNGTCSENGSRIALSGDISTTIAVTCLNGHWSAPGGTITGADGPKIVTATVTDPAGNVSYTSVGILKYTTAPTAVITNTPQINDQQLDIRIEGVGVTHYRYKIGDDEMECGPYSSGYSSPASVLEAIDDDLEDDGDKKICVVGIDTYGNAQAFSSATSYVWEKDTTVP